MDARVLLCTFPGSPGGGPCRVLRGMPPGGVRTGGSLPVLSGAWGMTLRELSPAYRAAAVPIRARLRQLRRELATATDPEEIWHIKRRIAELTPILTQMNELAELTEHYYERGYYRNEKYTL